VKFDEVFFICFLKSSLDLYKIFKISLFFKSHHKYLLFNAAVVDFTESNIGFIFTKSTFLRLFEYKFFTIASHSALFLSISLLTESTRLFKKFKGVKLLSQAKDTEILKSITIINDIIFIVLFNILFFFNLNIP
jgi:Kef-type K+ transport system membrane component KefB